MDLNRQGTVVKLAGTNEDGEIVRSINFDLLKQMLSEQELDGNEIYEFTWVGKKKAVIEANKPIRKTLRPDLNESVNWNSTENVYIEGDNLEALKLLQESYLKRVKFIYIDPPYNTGSYFVYRDNFHISAREYDEESGSIDEEGNHLFRNTDSNGRFHSDWCSMIYPRLMLARNLLSDDGVIFISIDDNECISENEEEETPHAKVIRRFVYKELDGNGEQVEESYIPENEEEEEEEYSEESTE